MEFYSKDIYLENTRVRLVPFTEYYEDDLKKIIYDNGVEFSVKCAHDEDVKAYITHTIRQRENHQAYPFIIIDKETNEVAGSTRFGNIIFHNRRLEIGWTWYGEKYRGTGLNKACKFVLLDYAFQEMGFRRVQFSADIDNVRSQRAIKKLGATQEGIFRANYIDHQGNSKDDVYFSIIHGEWDGLKKSIFKEFIE